MRVPALDCLRRPCLDSARTSAGPRPGRPAAVAAALLVLATAACSSDPGPATTPDVDVVLIVLDTLRADHVSAFGHGRQTTPALDHLASVGARFTEAYAQSSWTAPSMVSLFQGRHVASEFVRMPDTPTLAQRLAEAGFRAVGFQDNILLAPGNGFEAGFESYDMEAGPVRIREVLGAHDPRPLFAYFHFVDPHDPYAPLPHNDVFAPGEPDPGRLARFRAHLDEVRPELPAGRREALAHEAAAEAERQIALYDGDVRQTDRRVAFVLELLTELGRRERTLILVTADHGECLWDRPEVAAALTDERRAHPLTAFKRTHNALVTHELTRVPLVLAGPGVPPGVTLDGLCENVDLLPTIFDLLGLPIPRDTDGTSLVPAMEAAASGRAHPGKDFAFSNTGLFSALRTRDGRTLIAPWLGDAPSRRVAYDRSTDPRERMPLPADRPDLAPLHRALDALRQAALHAEEDEDMVDAETRRRLEALGYVER